MIVKILTVTQIISAVIMSATILMQARGSGLSGVFGGGSEIFRTKRGIEKTLFVITIVFAIIFFGSSLAIVIL